MFEPCPGCQNAGRPDICAHSAEDWHLATELARAFHPGDVLTPARIWPYIADAESIRPLCPPGPWTVRRLPLIGHADGGCVINEDLVCAVTILAAEITLTPLLRIDPQAQRRQIAGEIAHRIRADRFKLPRPDTWYAGITHAEQVAREYGDRAD